MFDYIGIIEATYDVDGGISAGYVALFKKQGDRGDIGVGYDFLSRSLSNQHSPERAELIDIGLSEHGIRTALRDFSVKVTNSQFDFRPEQFPKATTEEFNKFGLIVSTPNEIGYYAVQIFGEATNPRVLEKACDDFKDQDSQSYGFVRFYPQAGL